MKDLNQTPQAFYGILQGGKVVMLPAEDGQWLNKTTVTEALPALEERVAVAEAKLLEVKADLARETQSHKDSRDREDQMALSLRAVAQSNFRLAKELEAERKVRPRRPMAYLNTREGDPTWPRVYVSEAEAKANQNWVTNPPLVETHPLFLAPKPSRGDLRDLVDNVWNYVTESTEVPCTSTADKLINEVFGEGLDRAGCREDLFIEDEDGNPEGFIKWYERHFGAQPYKGASHVTDCENSWRGALLHVLENKQ